MFPDPLPINIMSSLTPAGHEVEVDRLAYVVLCRLLGQHFCLAQRHLHHSGRHARSNNIPRYPPIELYFTYNMRTYRASVRDRMLIKVYTHATFRIVRSQSEKIT